jgi:serine/threonine protein kinase
MGQTWSQGIVSALQSGQRDNLVVDKGKPKGPPGENSSEAEADGFDYIHFAKFLAMRHVEIVPLNKLVCLDSGIDLEQSIEERRVQLEAVGAGTSMQVVLAKWDSRIVAAKVPRTVYQQTDRRRRQRLYNSFMYDIFFEIQIMSHKPLCDHPNIVKLLGISFNTIVSEVPEHNRIYPVLVVEAAHPLYPDLQRFVEAPSCPRPIPLDLVFGLIGDMADGLSILHSFGAFHGDIKPENILLFRSNESDRLLAKIGDFGSTGAESSNDAPRWPTEDWAPPEWFDEELSDGISESVGRVVRDVYSFGLVCGYLASNGQEAEERDGKISQEFWRLAIEEIYPGAENQSLEPLFKVLKETTCKVPARRMQSLSSIRVQLIGK